MIGQQITEESGVGFLSHKTLRHANACHRFRQCRCHPAETLLRRARELTEFHAEVTIDHVEHRSHREHHEE